MSAPKTIYLQWQDGGDTGEMTWCTELIMDDDVEYIRKDISDKRIATLTEQLKAAEKRAKYLERGHVIDSGDLD
jgi:hypothetical protein